MAAITSARDPADLIDALLRSVHHSCYLVGHGRRPLATLMPLGGGSPLILVEFWPVEQAGEATAVA